MATTTSPGLGDGRECSLTLTTRHGKQGVLNTASNGQLENEFGTKKEEDVVQKILEKGDIQSTEVRCRFVPVSYPRCADK
jgi:hypothetical protein